ncbi:MAG: ABC transporter permease [Clostridiales bacterium]|nr:ABC transporter permease [Clostridiales bacterium]
MNSFIKVIFIEWKLNNRNFLNVFFALFFPVMMLMLFGTMYGNEPIAQFGGFGSIDVSIPGYICIIIAVTGLMTLPLTLSQYRERKILKRFMVTPIKPIDLLSSQLIVNTVTTIIGMIILLIVAKIIFEITFIGNFLKTTIAFIIVLLSMFSIGLFIAGISKTMKAATVISYIIYFPMLFLSGATIPLEFMPRSIINLSKIFPLTYGVELLKGVWLGGNLLDYMNDILILSSIIIIFISLSIKFFKWE